ncbi:hypothetical protein L3X38_036307 [Prunus dulcis]|uniref:Uncharacterized protein n=1 Tax=Prunus dulcis TaxID=3755 RepID=A0AAD4YPJ6_PRUDU|nr:hypothetical protein L3X38_036307 [Prunus dulcis]
MLVQVLPSDSSSSTSLPAQATTFVLDIISTSPHDSSAPTSQSLDLHMVSPITSQNRHPMQTRSKSGIFKHKAFLTTNISTNVVSEPHTYASAAKVPQWQLAMQEEMDALKAQDYLKSYFLPIYYKSDGGCRHYGTSSSDGCRIHLDS